MKLEAMFTIVISGVNLTEGGILSVLTDCLKSVQRLNEQLRCRVVVLVHSKALVKEFLSCFEIQEYPHIKHSWRQRLKFEYLECKRISEELKPDIWISLHDITPNVVCKYQVVYCHNPSPFYQLPAKDYLTNYKFTLFNAFYSYLYAINIKRNKYVIVQQDWLREEFARRYGVKTIVAYPEGDTELAYPQAMQRNEVYTFLYPSFPRVFKNFEVILKAAELLSAKRNDFKVILTVDGSENQYSKNLKRHFPEHPNVELIGLQSRENTFELYKQTDCLLFPSKLETWGLPLSEIKEFGKPVIVSDLKYAHETMGDYDKVKFFAPDDFVNLSAHMDQAIDNHLLYDHAVCTVPEQPFFSNWEKLITFLINDTNNFNL